MSVDLGRFTGYLPPPPPPHHLQRLRASQNKTLFSSIRAILSIKQRLAAVGGYCAVDILYLDNEMANSMLK